MPHNFDKLAIYQRSLSLAQSIVECFIDFRPRSLAEQLISSAVSIPSNISEGAERSSDKEFRRFIDYASGSAAELYTQLQIVHTMDYPDPFLLKIDELINECRELRSMIRGFRLRISNDYKN